jgi:hypothetical protein
MADRILIILLSLAVSAGAEGAGVGLRVFFDNLDQMKAVNAHMNPLNEPTGLFGCYEATAANLLFLSQMNLRYETYKSRHPSAPTIAELDSFYYTYTAMVDSLISWAAQYPEIARVETIGVSQQELRNIYALKISDSVSSDQDEPVLLFDGTHHACEIMGMEICLALADTLLHNYDTQQAITDIINSTEIWIVPLINPDGNSAVHAGISLNYRKNGRDLDGDGILYEYGCNNSWTCPTEGIDLNRNYDWYWSSGGSPVPMNYYYRGSSPGSESENQAITSLVGEIRPVLSLTYHSWGEVVYMPWQWSNYLQAPDSAVIESIGVALAANIMKENGYEHYDPVLSDGFSGQAINWQYARHGVLCFSPETVQAQDFIPETEERRNSIIHENLRGVFFLLSRANGNQITGRVTDRSTEAPLEAEIRVLQAYSSLVDARFSEPLYGRYRRLVNPGTYTIEAHCQGYPVHTYPGIAVTGSLPTILNIQMSQIVTGDANSSGTLNGTDVIYLVNALRGIAPLPSPVQKGDANGDCQISGLDVIYLVNYFKGGAFPLTCDAQ